jgi:hypothetical protein
VLLAGIIGLVVGALLVGAAWLGTSLVGGSKDGAAGDVATACEILDRLPAAKDLSLAYADRLEAAGSLADAAARDDARYRHLAEDAKQALQAAQFNDGAKVDERIGAAREDCRGF